MPLNIFVADSAQMAAESKLNRWQKKFDEQWNGPDVEKFKSTFWNGMPEPLKEEMRKQIPSAAHDLDKRYGG
jgi:hypothetical protein